MIDDYRNTQFESCSQKAQREGAGEEVYIQGQYNSVWGERIAPSGFDGEGSARFEEMHGER